MKKDPVKYKEFYRDYGVFFKEGILLESDHTLRVGCWNFSARSNCPLREGRFGETADVRVVELQAGNEDELERVRREDAGRPEGYLLPLRSQVPTVYSSRIASSPQLFYTAVNWPNLPPTTRPSSRATWKFSSCTSRTMNSSSSLFLNFKWKQPCLLRNGCRMSAIRRKKIASSVSRMLYNIFAFHWNIILGIFRAKCQSNNDM